MSTTFAISSDTKERYANSVNNLIFSKTYEYNGLGIGLTRSKDGVVYVNLTEVAKAFPNKNLTQIINSQEIKEYCESLSKLQNYSLADLLIVKRGGNDNGTWAHQKVALRVAQKLSPDFAVMVDSWIEELLTTGKVDMQNTIPRSYAEALRQLADEVETREKTQLLLAEKTEQLDESKEWFSIKRWAKLHRKNWRNYSWRRLKAVSHELGYEVKKIFDGNYEEVNIYHRNVFEVVYGK